MRKAVSVLITFAVLATFLAIPAQASGDTPFGNVPIKEESTAREEDITVATIDTIADISDANRRDSDGNKVKDSDDSDKITYEEMFETKNPSADKTEKENKTDTSSKKPETVRDKIDSSTEKADKMKKFTNKYMKREGDDDDDEPLSDSVIYPEDAESFREYNLEEEKSKKPEDFSGSYKESVGDDGSVTYLYDSGTIITKKPDGTTEGFDYTGRRITGEKDGTIVTHFSDGSEAKVYNDGRKEFYDKSDDSRTEFYDDGTSTTYFKDGSRAEYNEDGSGTYISSTGVRSDFAEDGSDNDVYYFEGGGSVKVTDDKGNPIIGEHVIEGPNGEKFTYSNTIDFGKEYKDGETQEGRYSMTCEGNGKEFSNDMYVKFSDKENVMTVDTKNADGSTFKLDGKSIEDENGNFEANIDMKSVAADGSTLDININGKGIDSGESKEEFTMTIRDADGSKGDFNFVAETDKDGNSTVTGKVESRGADGSTTDFSINGTEDKDGNSSMNFNVEVHDADGSEFKMDCSQNENTDGTGSVDMNMTSYDAKTGEKGEFKGSSNGETSKITYNGTDKDGKVTSLDFEANEDGTGKMNITETDKDGNVKSINADIDTKNDTATIVREDGSFFKMDAEGNKEMENKENGTYIRTNSNDDIVACHLALPNSKSTYDFKDGTGVLVDEKSGEKVMWTHDDDGSLVLVSPLGGKYTTDEDGNLYHNGTPVKFNGDWVNVRKGITPGDDDETEEPTEPETEEPTEPETEEPTDPPTEAPTEGLSIKPYLGSWSYNGGVHTTWTLKTDGDNLYLRISGYSSDGNEYVEMPCTYELTYDSLTIHCDLVSGGTAVITPTGDGRMQVVTHGAYGETAYLSR